MIAAITHGFPWPLIPGLLSLFIAFFINLRLPHHIDRDKVVRTKDMSRLYSPFWYGPPLNVLTQRGRQLYFCYYACVGVFVASFLLLAALDSKFA